jgi:hypothetical protein
VHWEGVPDAELAAKAKEGNGGFRIVADFLQLVPAPAFVKDKRGRALFLNSRARTLWKVRSDKGIGQSLAQLFKNPALDIMDRAADREVLRSVSARVTAHIHNKPHFFTLTFPFLDTGEDMLLGVILVCCGKCDG